MSEEMEAFVRIEKAGADLAQEVTKAEDVAKQIATLTQALEAASATLATQEDVMRTRHVSILQQSNDLGITPPSACAAYEARETPTGEGERERADAGVRWDNERQRVADAEYSQRASLAFHVNPDGFDAMEAARKHEARIALEDAEQDRRRTERAAQRRAELTGRLQA
jgi:hypothetical protein